MEHLFKTDDSNIVFSQDEAFDNIMEAMSHEPNWVKVMKWAVSIHFNSPHTDDGQLIPSHIGNYFSTIRFKNWSTNNNPAQGQRPTQLALYYEGRLKSEIVHGSTTITDVRPFTIMYAIDGKDEINSVIKDNKAFLKALETGTPNFSKMAPELHDLAQNCVRYAMVYWKNDAHDALIVKGSQLERFGEILKDSNLAPTSVLRDGSKKGGVGSGKYINPQGYVFTVPADKVKVARDFISQCNWYGGVETEVTDENGHTSKKKIGWGTSTEFPTKTLEDGSMLCGVSSHNEFANVVINKLLDMGVIENDKVDKVSLLTDGGRQKAGGMNAVINKIANGDSPDAASSGSSKKPPVTLAFDSDSFGIGAKLTNAMVRKATLANSRSTADISIDDDAESVTITGMAEKDVAKIIAFLDAKGIKYSKM